MGDKLLFSVIKKDLNVTFFSGTGKGGQHRNKHQNCVRMNHKDSGATVTGQSNKSRQANIKEALNNLIKHPKFIVWNTRKVNEIVDGERLEDKVEEMMKDIKIEYLEDDKWVEEEK